MRFAREAAVRIDNDEGDGNEETERVGFREMEKLVGMSGQKLHEAD